MSRDSRIRLGRIMLLLAMTCGVGLGAVIADSADTPDAQAVKRDWDGLTPEQKEAHRARVLATIHYSAGGPSSGTLAPLTPGDTCQDATFEEGGIPYIVSGNTTGQTDRFTLTDDQGMILECNGGGSQFPGTGVGPDLIYRIRTDVGCIIRIDMSPTLADLALYVIENCRKPVETCIGVDDSGLTGFPEAVGLVTLPGRSYFVVVDGYLGAAGAFDLTVSELGGETCELVPVELQSFSVD
jgi:hypothetical protein